MDLREALVQITHIQQQLARSEVFRGYRSATVGFTAVLAVAAASAQRSLVPDPENQLSSYLLLWVGVAAISVTVTGVEIVLRARASGSGLTRQMTRLAVEQFLPAIAAGAVVTAVIAIHASGVAWMLPGLWCILFSLGVFASYRLLPEPVFWVAVYYLLCGVGALWWGQGARAFSPWLMGVSFGGGQLLSAAILYWKLERTDGR